MGLEINFNHVPILNHSCTLLKNRRSLEENC